MKTYKSFDEIKRDLRQLSLEKQIALEELKIVKNNFGEIIRPTTVISSVLKIASKYGFLVLVKKILK
ncbi:MULTISPECIES: hypothetical protein [Tenacibaculum]|uniref:hypothetical protein n=1 Tax=Tenacibaculum TaxID=104267 RepID=UPI001F0B0DF2|nr:MULTISPECIES: hypothetical protein [Tenacibaculum]MCH3881757.1 hypothetical protein [Tenacibaculum aquimarinum]MDO6598675.1 hypothetical protein [Tenacibaculum sp. 1_MG-2023]